MPKPKAKAEAARSRFEDDEGRGVTAFLIRPLLNNPKDALAILVAAAMVAAILGNALFMQAGRHPSPMFGRAAPVAFLAPAPAAASASAPVNPMPRSRPLEADAKPAEVRAAETRPQSQPYTRANDPMGQLVARTAAPPPAAAPVMRPPAPIPAVTKVDPAAGAMATQRRIAAVQRALTEFGYGQLKPTGVAGTDTQAAISKFEKERKLPVTGQVSDRMVRELAAVTGRPIE